MQQWPQHACTLTLQYLSSCQASDGGWPGIAGGPSEGWATAEVLLCLLAAPHMSSAEQVTKGLRWLEEHQNADGGWSCAVYGNDVPDTSSTADGTFASIHGGSQTDAPQKGLAWLMRNQNRSGGWSPLGAADRKRPQFGHTAYALRALAHAGPDNKIVESIQEALRFLHHGNRQSVFSWSISPAYGPDVTLTCYVLRALIDLEAIRQYSIERDRLRRWVGWITDTQRPSGAWSDWRGIADSVEAASYVLEISSSIGLSPITGDFEFLSKALDFILRCQAPDGSFREALDENAVHPVWVSTVAFRALYSIIGPNDRGLRRIEDNSKWISRQSVARSVARKKDGRIRLVQLGLSRSVNSLADYVAHRVEDLRNAIAAYPGSPMPAVRQELTELEKLRSILDILLFQIGQLTPTSDQQTMK
jgi:prenyltransferase beta subunit